MPDPTDTDNHENANVYSTRPKLQGESPNYCQFNFSIPGLTEITAINGRYHYHVPTTGIFHTLQICNL